MIVTCDLPGGSVPLAALAAEFPGASLCSGESGPVLAWDDGLPPPDPPTGAQYGTAEVLVRYVRDYRRPDPRYPVQARRQQAVDPEVAAAADAFLATPAARRIVADLDARERADRAQAATLRERERDLRRRVERVYDEHGEPDYRDS